MPSPLDISILAAGTLLGRENFIARGPPSCPDRLDKLLRQPFGRHLGSEALMVVGQTDEVHFQTRSAVDADNGIHHGCLPIVGRSSDRAAINEMFARRRFSMPMQAGCRSYDN